MKRARIQLYRNQPFFGYLAQHLTIVKTENLPTMAVDDRGRMYFNPEFVDTLSEEELNGVVAHEVMHKALRGFKRQGNRDNQKWNIAQDLVINYILIHENDFELPDGALLPDEEGTFDFAEGAEEQFDEMPDELADQIRELEPVEDIDDSNFEQVYDKVPVLESPEGGWGHDEHIQTGDGDGSGDSEAGVPDQEVEGVGKDEIPDGRDDVDWEAAVAAAQEHAAGQGKEPGGMEDMLDVTKQEGVDYKRLISQTIASLVPSEYTFRRPHKSSRAVGAYLPDLKVDEGLDVIVAMDTSGSVSDDLLKQFFGEVKNLVDTFENVQLTVIQHDAAVQRVDEYDNASTSDFDTVEIAGRGGTSHIPVFKEIEEEYMVHGPTVFIGLTDGYTTVPDEIPRIDDVIWVINNHTVTKERLKHGQIVRIEDEPA